MRPGGGRDDKRDAEERDRRRLWLLGSAILGVMISTTQSQTPLAFAAIILLTLISILLFYAIEMLEKRFVTWTP
jgi:ABC-type nitrate/sulfonate/bicarbonate transport system permease component